MQGAMEAVLGGWTNVHPHIESHLLYTYLFRYLFRKLRGLRGLGPALAHLTSGAALASRFAICVQVRPIVCARSRFMITTTPPPRHAPVPIGDKVCLPIRFTCPIASTLADLPRFCRSRPLWLIRSTLTDPFHFGRSGQLWSIRSTLADQV